MPTYFYIIKPETFNFLKSFDILVMVVLGGLGSTTGAIIAAIFITAITAALQSFPAIRMILSSPSLLFHREPIYRPQGLMGNKELAQRFSVGFGVDVMNLMEINNLDKSFGGLSALLDFTFQIAENELVGLIGP